MADDIQTRLYEEYLKLQEEMKSNRMFEDGTNHVAYVTLNGVVYELQLKMTRCIEDMIIDPMEARA